MKIFLLEKTYYIESYYKCYCVIGAFQEEAGAIAAKQKQINFAHRVNELIKKINDFHATLPKMDFSLLEKMPSLTKWPSGISQQAITQEMRCKREQEKITIKEISERNSKKAEAFHLLQKEKINEYKSQLNITKEEEECLGLFLSELTTEFEIKSIELQ